MLLTGATYSPSIFIKYVADNMSPRNKTDVNNNSIER